MSRFWPESHGIRGEHRAIGHAVGSGNCADVHTGNQLRADVCRQLADQSDRAHSTNFSAGPGYRRMTGSHRATRDSADHWAICGGFQFAVHRSHSSAHDRRLGSFAAALVHASSSPAIDTGEFNSLLRHFDHGVHSAQHAGRARAGGQSNINQRVRRSSRDCLCRLFSLPLIGSRESRGRLPGWLKLAALAGLSSSLIAGFIARISDR